ncbi:uncharacterized protein LOC131643101 [Vicia villosa]|uniref:uncharacterized protein LOC131643101 n=1 Tax=Vicia villosa TaxID=3911 RepID=UPI00273C07EB|nr:uncharacterized protein LOC131643101 [Vicia villosa]XP_058769231.1 uncharacterized protein LOC131643101 [Vicia villosa]
MDDCRSIVRRVREWGIGIRLSIISFYAHFMYICFYMVMLIRLQQNPKQKIRGFRGKSIFRAQSGNQVPKSKSNNITWIIMECPGQRNEIDCGFYMLKFMKEILLMDRIEIPSKYFDEFKRAYYSSSQLDEL